MSDLKELIAKCERATGGSWQLDSDVLKALGWSIRRVSRLGLGGRSPGGDRAFPPGSTSANGYPVPKVTTSIDSALDLCERKLPGWKISIHGTRELAQVELHDGTTPYAAGKRSDSGSFSRPMPLAIILATLKALEKDSAT